MGRRVTSGQQRGMRDGGDRRLRIRAREDDGLACEGVERRRQPARRPEKPHAIGPRRVERDQQDVRPPLATAAAAATKASASKQRRRDQRV